MSDRSAAVSDAASSGSLYQSASKIYPREVSGRYTTLRKLAVVVLLGAYYGVAWLTIDGQQALLFDLPARKFHIFGLTLWPQDFIYLSALLIIGAVSLFFFTALLGRVWCGYACPQTVWTELFIRIEQWTEGKRSRRMKLDKGPLTAEKFLRKGAKQVLWVALALFTGFTLVGYFTPIRELAGKLASFSLGPWEAFWIVLYSFATYGNAGFLREQVCKYMCPYARFQSAMFDRDTFTVAYDAGRGEPRGGRRRGADPAGLGLGDCVDCHLCVQVCPTGIDIRDGLQYECIDCAACIDVCNDVMDRMKYPRGLISYTTENGLSGRSPRILRPRVLAYAGILVLLVAALLGSLASRTPLILDVIRDRNALYREVAGQRVENVYTLKVLNLHHDAHTYMLTASGIDGLSVAEPLAPIQVDANSVEAVSARLSVPRDHARGVQNIQFHLQAIQAPELSITETARFIGPF